MAFLNVRYNGADAKTYQGIEMAIRDESPVVFNTNAPRVDYLTALAVASHLVGDYGQVMGSSSIDHFGYDGGEILDEEMATSREVALALRTARAYLGM